MQWEGSEPFEKPLLSPEAGLISIQYQRWTWEFFSDQEETQESPSILE